MAGGGGPITRLAVAAAMFLAGCANEGGEARVTEMRLEAPRDYGYVMGDRIEHTLTLRLPEGETLDTAALPATGPINDWLVLLDSRWLTLPGQPAGVHRLQVTYQVFKGVRVPEQVTVPPLTLRLDDAVSREIRTPAWTFTMAPVIPPDETDETLRPREPSPPKPTSDASLYRRLWLSLEGVAASGLLLGLRTWLRRQQTRPFARARRELRGLLGAGQDPATLRLAARCLHRAFDQTFGETLFPGQIDRFCAANPAFAPLRGQLVAFFDWSRDLFFAPGSPVIEPRTHHWLNDLAGRFAAAERRAG